MTEKQVVDLMKSSKNEREWNVNVDKVKAACGGDYPSFWFSAIVLSSVASNVAAKWGGDADIHISIVK